MKGNVNEFFIFLTHAEGVEGTIKPKIFLGRRRMQMNSFYLPPPLIAWGYHPIQDPLREKGNARDFFNSLPHAFGVGEGWGGVYLSVQNPPAKE